MGWKESNVSEHVGKDGGPIENKDVTARELFESRMAGLVSLSLPLLARAALG
jgi:hypothetical protein